MEKASVICLLVIILAFCFLVPPSNAIPLSRVQRSLPLQEAAKMPSVEEIIPKPDQLVEIGSSATPRDDAAINARMVLETQDYAPPVANNHHKPPGWS